MYNMKIFGYKCRFEVVLAAFLVGMAASCFLFGSCSKMSVNEGFETLFGSTGAPLDHSMGAGVHSSWEKKSPATAYDKKETYTIDNDNQGGLYFFSKNEFKPECCGSEFSNSQGCACITKEQSDYINRRGGNRSGCVASDF